MPWKPRGLLSKKTKKVRENDFYHSGHKHINFILWLLALNAGTVHEGINNLLSNNRNIKTSSYNLLDICYIPDFLYHFYIICSISIIFYLHTNFLVWSTDLVISFYTLSKLDSGTFNDLFKIKQLMVELHGLQSQLTSVLLLTPKMWRSNSKTTFR